MTDLINFFETKITPPQPWGVYHLCCLAVTALAAAVICAYGDKLCANKALVRRLSVGMGIFLVFIEILKNVFYGLEIDGNGNVYWDYPWHIFPFQFCSTPLYACIALLFTRKDGAVREGLSVFLATYAPFGGATVLLYPYSVFNEYLFVCIHTMVWHGLLFLLGVMQWAGGTFRFKSSSWLKGTAVFLVFVAIALILNLSLPGLSEKYGFNMFYISPYVPCTILLLAGLWQAAPYPVFLAVYVLGFAAISAAIFWAAGGFSLWVRPRYSYSAPYCRAKFRVRAAPYVRRKAKLKKSVPVRR